MSWNYRAVKKVSQGRAYYQIHEVYYNQDDKPWCMSQEPMTPVGETEEELMRDLARMVDDVRLNPVFVPPKKWAKAPWEKSEIKRRK